MTYKVLRATSIAVVIVSMQNNLTPILVLSADPVLTLSASVPADIIEFNFGMT